MDTRRGPLLSIGQFARRAGLSVSTVRFYSDCGLLIPARVDPQTGYRSYAPEQLALGEQLAALRALGMPLDELAQVVGAGTADAAVLLARHEQRLYGQFQVQRQLLRRVGELIDGHRALPQIAVEYAAWPAQHVLSVPCSASGPEFHAVYTAAVARLRAAAAPHAVAGDDFGLYHAGEYLGGPLQVEICLPVAAPQPVSAPHRLVSLPATPVAFTVCAGDWTTYSAVFAALNVAVGAAGRTVYGSFTRGRASGMELGLLLV